MNAPLRILICEDETLIRLDLRALVEAAGFVVAGEARDGIEAVAQAAATEPDLILMDVKMPELDGISAARQIIAARPVPIVMVTAFADGELVRSAAEAGAFGYLVKPFRGDHLMPAIETARARHEELAELRRRGESLAEALETRKLIDRAKGLLMTHHGIAEPEAYARLRTASQNTGKPIRQLAEALIATLDEGTR